MTNNQVELLYAPTFEEANLALQKGYEPVECSFGWESAVGEHLLDHHGKYSGKEAVSIKAARLALAGTRLNRFVVTGAADTDQMYAVAALGGAIPIRMEDAEAIADMDVDPIGRSMLDSRYTRILLHRQEYLDSVSGQESSDHSLRSIIRIFTPESLLEEAWVAQALEKAISMEEDRQTHALGAVQKLVPGKVALVSGQIGPAWNEWYTQAPIVVAYVANQKRVTVGLCPKKGGLLSDQSGFDLLGEDGLSELIPSLDEIVSGWGGRPEIIGSPRGQSMELGDATEVYKIIKNRL